MYVRYIFHWSRFWGNSLDLVTLLTTCGKLETWKFQRIFPGHQPREWNHNLVSRTSNLGVITISVWVRIDTCRITEGSEKPSWDSSVDTWRTRVTCLGPCPLNSWWNSTPFWPLTHPCSLSGSGFRNYAKIRTGEVAWFANFGIFAVMQKPRTLLYTNMTLTKPLKP